MCDNYALLVPSFSNILTSTGTSATMFTSDQVQHIHRQYQEDFKDNTIAIHDIDPYVESMKTIQRFDEELRRDIFFTTASYQQSTRSKDSVVRVGATNVFGIIRRIYKHYFMDKANVWILLDTFPLAEKCGQFWTADNKTVTSRLHQLKEFTNPLITAVEDGKMWFINC